MKKSASVLIAAFFLSGCLVTDQRLPANEPPSADAPVAGFWQSPWPAMLTRESLNISLKPGADYYIAVRAQGKYYGEDDKGEPVETIDTRGYRAYPSRINGRLFFSVLTIQNGVNVYAVLEAVLENGGKRLVLREPADEAVEKAFSDGRLRFRMEEDAKVAVNSPDELAAWLATLTDADFKTHEIYERWPAPVDELAESLHHAS